MKAQTQTQLPEQSSSRIIERQIKASSLIDSENLRQKLRIIHCQYGKEVILFCCDKQCINSALVCSSNQCQCRSKHQDCFRNFGVNSFIKHVNNRILHQKTLQGQIQKQFDQLIDSISEIRDQLLKLLKGSLFENQEIDFIQAIHNDELLKISGKQLSPILAFLENKRNQSFQDKAINSLKQIELLNNQVKSHLDQYKTNTLTKIKEIFLNPDFDASKTKATYNWKYDSKIITTKEQIQTLKGFMPKGSFKRLNLLYRASEQNFKTKMFYQKCSNIPHTITLIKTTKDKIIGGYTPVPWKKYQNPTQQQDPSGETFIFSLTNKDKFTMSNNSQATYYYNQSWGPEFGRNSHMDLSISDGANQKSSGNKIFLTMNFKNSKYARNKESYQLFTGFDENTFLASQWQVFQVIF